MFRDALFIGSRDAWWQLRSREAILWLFLMPIAFFWFIGTVTAGFGGGGDAPTPLTLLVPPDAGFLGNRVARELDRNGFSVRSVSEIPAGAKPGRLLVLPPRFTSDVVAGEETVVRFHLLADDLSSDRNRIRAQRAVYTVLADVVASAAGGSVPSEESIDAIRSLPRNVALDIRRAGAEPRIPSGFEQAIPGIMVMFTLLVLLTTGAVTLVVERRAGLLRRLASTPMRRSSIVLGKWIGRMALALVQVAFAMTAGTLLFDMSWGPAPLMVVVVVAAWAALCASLGLLLGVLARTEAQAIGVGVLASNVLAALGGCWWPVEVTPSWMQTLAKSLPTGWAMDALHRLVSFGQGPVSVLPHLAALLLGALVLGWLATRRFRYS